MIEFKVISSPDKSQLANYRHEGTELTIGKGDAQMVLDDPQLGSVQIRLFFERGQVFLENLTPEIEVRVNGKAIDGATPLKVKDNLSMGRTTINFTALDTKPVPIPEAFEHPQAATRFAADTNEKAILDALEYLENSSAGSNSNSPPSPPKPPPIRK